VRSSTAWRPRARKSAVSAVADHPRMDDARIGRALWVLRRRRHMSQSEVAATAGISQSAISLIERGHVALLTMRTVRAAFGAVEAGFEGKVLWRAADIDRVLDEQHAQLVAVVAERLRSLTWEVSVEVTFSEYGERGSMDVLAVRAPTTALVVEVKTQIASVEEMLRRLDVKGRLAPKIVFDRHGWRPSTIGMVLVLPDASTARRQVKRHASVLGGALPVRGRELTKWLRQPSATALSGLEIPSPSNRNGALTRRDRPCRRQTSARLVGDEKTAVVVSGPTRRGPPGRPSAPCPSASRAPS
jgi:transcriptional regulator with XRE-family HTH domain